MSNYADFSKFISKMEVYTQKELKQKTERLIIPIVLLLIPNLFIKTVAILYLSASMLAYDIKHKNAELLYILPFSRKELYLYNLIFLTAIVTVTSVVSQIFGEAYILPKLVFIVNSLTLLLAIFGFIMFFSSIKKDGLGWTLFILIIDRILGGFGSSDIMSPNFNPYNLISITHRGNTILSFLFSCLICLFSYLTFIRKGGEN